MPAADVLTRPSRGPDLVLTYGPEADHVADVRFGRTGRPDAQPLIVFLHGGFWRSAYDRAHTGPLAAALADAGFTVCTPEFRRTGQPGGGWPGTFDDVSLAVRVLPALVAQHSDGRVDADRVILSGHSAGGQLSIWAARACRPAGVDALGDSGRGDGGPGAGSRGAGMRDAGMRDEGMRDAGMRDEAMPGAGSRGEGAPAAGKPRLEVVSLAGVCDLAACYRQGLDDDAAGALMGGGPDAFPDRYAAADPMSLVPLGVRMTLLHGTKDQRVPWEYSRDLAANAQAAGDQAELRLLPDRDHFALIDPLSAAWPVVAGAFGAAADRLAGPS
jgi:acetyl esterase/lipase